MRGFEHGGDVYAHPGCVDFSASLNPLGMPEEARRALVSSVDDFSRYPDPASTRLVEALARAEGVSDSHVLATAGASDAFARICQVLRPRLAVVLDPCYAGYEQALAWAGTCVRRVTLHASHDFDPLVDDVERALPGADLLVLANPNNPTARLIEEDVLEDLIRAARSSGALVVLDECFCPLATPHGHARLTDDVDGLVVVGALTKTHALAGLRVGHLVCSDVRLTHRLAEAGAPWAVSVPAQVAGVASLGAQGYLERSRAFVATERAWLAERLGSLGCACLPGQANFILFRAREGLAGDLSRRGVLIRDCAGFPGLTSGSYRVAVRTRSENELLVAAMREVL